MNAFLATIRFELERRWLAPAVALAMGIAVFAVPWLPDTGSRVPPAELRTVAAGVAALVGSVLLAMALGESLYSRDAADGRATFFFARPIGEVALAAARWTAALLVIVVSVGLIALPSLASGVRLEVPTWTWEWVDGWPALALLVLLSGAILLLSSAVTLAARARTSWIVLELAALVGAGLALRATVSGLFALHLPQGIQRLAIGLALAAPLALVAIYLAPFAFGRTDLARAHRAQAVAATLSLALGALGAELWAHDYANPDFDELAPSEISGRALGDDLFLIGGGELGRPEIWTGFLYDGKSGATRRATRASTSDPVRSGDVQRAGDALFWIETTRDDSQLVRAERSSGGVTSETTAVRFDRPPSRWAVSDEGTRVAAIMSSGSGEPCLLGVHEVASGRLLHATRFEPFEPWSARLEAEGEGFRLLIDRAASPLESWRIERDGSAARTASRELARGDSLPFLDARHDRYYVKAAEPAAAWVVLAASTLEEIARLRPALLEQPGAHLGFALGRFADGSVATVARQDERRELTLFDASGGTLRTIAANGIGSARYVGSGGDHVLYLATRSQTLGEDSARGWSVERFDFDSGERREVARDLRPLSGWIGAESGAALLASDDGHYFALDLESGVLRELSRPTS